MTGRARILRLSAFWLMVAVSVFVGLFVAGETLSDPGGADGSRPSP